MLFTRETRARAARDELRADLDREIKRRQECESTAMELRERYARLLAERSTHDPDTMRRLTRELDELRAEHEKLVADYENAAEGSRRGLQLALKVVGWQREYEDEIDKAYRQLRIAERELELLRKKKG